MQGALEALDRVEELTEEGRAAVRLRLGAHEFMKLSDFIEAVSETRDFVSETETGDLDATRDNSLIG
jgi:hypothetical protein